MQFQCLSKRLADRTAMRALVLLAVLTGLSAAPAAAEVKGASDSGFAVSHVHRVAATPAAVWTALAAPSRWWSGAHSWSGDARNFSLEPSAGGCFCERWGAGDAASSVEHGRVIYAVPGSQLRMVGAFGPLQSEALAGTFTVTLTADGGGTKIAIDYVVGGHARFALKELAPAVDQVIGEQASRLAALFPPAG
jgi:uncharacterized protein YndB with AHSA1/START domain